jgi:hypothetical protein
MFRKVKSIEAKREGGWTVVVGQAYYYKRGSRDDRVGRMRMYDYHYEQDPRPIVGTVAVRLAYNGEDSMTFGSVQINDADFEDKITTMKAEALEKAATLNAVGAVAE